MSGIIWIGVAGAIVTTITTLLVIGMNSYQGTSSGGSSNIIGVYAAGCVSGALLIQVLMRVAKQFFLEKEHKQNLYGLNHGVLNISVPPASMWMNMGFWKQTTTSLPVACRTLLKQVLIEARLLQPDGMPPEEGKHTKLRIVDLGFGCGDQSLYLTQLVRKAEPPENCATEPPTAYLDRYVGLTIVPSQFCFAAERLRPSNLNESRIKLFCADAGNPNTWSEELYEAVTDISTRKDDSDVTSTHTTWILALDTLYHFTPSREPIFRHAFEELDASLMAFDLFLSDAPSAWHLFTLRIICFFAAMPFSNFLTITQYRKQLMDAGYDKDKIEIRDISTHVFAGLASFIEKQDTELKVIGLTVGKYKLAGKMFKWWARSGIVRGCIVIARR